MIQRLTLIVLLLIVACSSSIKARESKLQSRTAESITGVWKAKFEEAPALDIELKLSSGKLVGMATFYFVQNTDAGHVIKNKIDAPLIEPSFDGVDLLFTIKRNDGSVLKASIRFVAENEAVFKPADGPNVTDEMALSLKREK
jgi:hypothetical protein